jgi:hypothetical protein
MSLMRLLAVGRSFGTINDPPSRYRMTQQCLLPKFGSAKPAETGAQGPGAAVGEALGSGWVEKQSQIEQSVSQTDEAKVNMEDLAKLESRSVVPRASSKTQKAASRDRRWALIKNPFSQKPAPGKATAPLQGELLLEMVKPVRNDLSDADLEVVPVGEQVKSEDESGLLADRLVSIGLLWHRIASRIFGARQT